VGARHLDVAAVLDLSSRHPRPGPRALTLRIASQHMTLREIITRAVEVELRKAEARTEAALGAVLVAILGGGGARGVAASTGLELAAETERALEGFRDGSYRVLLDDRPVTDLDERLCLGLRSRVTFVRVVPLASG
jgi:hypothetical protein